MLVLCHLHVNGACGGVTVTNELETRSKQSTVKCVTHNNKIRKPKEIKIDTFFCFQMKSR